jgi:hypothetical protein
MWAFFSGLAGQRAIAKDSAQARGVSFILRVAPQDFHSIFDDPTDPSIA